MPRIIAKPSIIEAAGTKPKRIEEYVGRVNTGAHHVSVAKMTSPGGWEEPGQRPEFQEITVVLAGSVRVEYEGAEYVSVWLPAFSPDTVHRDGDE